MTPMLFGEAEDHDIAILIKQSAFSHYDLKSHYVNSLESKGVASSSLVAYPLAYPNNKVNATQINSYLEDLLPELKSIGVKTLYVADAEYFKKLTKETKAEGNLGYVLPCKIKGYEDFNVIYGVNYQSLVYNPELNQKLNRTLDTLANHCNDTYAAPGENIIQNAQYPSSLEDIKTALNSLHQYPELEVDTETFSLRVEEAGLGTIAFSWDQHSGVAFAVEYQALPEPIDGLYGIRVSNPEVCKLLREFFDTYKGRLTYHNSTFDIKVLIRALYMKDMADIPGMLVGLHTLTENIDDTKIIAYLATNSCAGNELGLKVLAQEFAGNWAQDEINDIRKIPLTQLLQYNLIDCLSTHYVKKKYLPIMERDNQREIYDTLMMPSAKLIVQLELTGLPLLPSKVAEAKQKLEDLLETSVTSLMNNTYVKETELTLKTLRWKKDYENRVKKAKNPLKIKEKDFDKFPVEPFNPNSGDQVRTLLYDVMDLPVLDYTDAKKPSTNKKTIDKLSKLVTNPTHLDILQQLKQVGEVSIMLSTFIPAFEKAVDKGDGLRYLLGNFNLGGTKSGRLSSSKPNLQNIPAGSTYAKWIKECFVSLYGWLFCGADFNSLEDYISALTTKDPNKLAVYEKGFDGHSLRAAYYFRDELPDIDLENPVSVNSIEVTHKHLRQKSKAPTFALTYQGTWHTLVRNIGFSEVEAKAIEANYHKLYQVSDEYVQQRLRQASNDGYVDVAFGLRLRTPMLSQVIFDDLGSSSSASAEGRTAGNALGQSYGLLNNRAAVAFMKKVWASEYRYDILPVALIHDAIYLMIKDDINVIKFVNDNLIAEMRWQELPEIQHDTVKIGAALGIFWPNWANEITIPNDSTEEEIIRICKTGIGTYNESLLKKDK